MGGQSEKPEDEQSKTEATIQPEEPPSDSAIGEEPPDLIEPEGDQPAIEETAPVPTETQTQTDKQLGLTTVELLWQVPGEAVEKYHLHYGFEETKLDHHLEIPVRTLERKQDQVHGPLFRYEIPGVPANHTVFFTIQAENQFGLSPSSPVQSVAPEARP